jgi:polyisoprenyl-teichoic acid--peptidoglycan teichoic acid transferase
MHHAAANPRIVKSNLWRLPLLYFTISIEERITMKRKWKIMIGVSVVLAAGVIWLRFQLDPDNRFDQNSLPVLAAPETPLPDTAALPGLLASGTQSIDRALTGTAAATEDAQETEPAKLKKTEGFNILLLGIDRRENEASRTDSIILIHIDPKKKKAALVTLPRDTRINVPGIGMTKINHVHVLEESRNGNEAATKSVIQAVSNFFQVPIHYFAKTDFNGFMNIVDTIGGIEMTIPKPVLVDGIQLQAGKQTLNGKAALALSRERFNLPNGDFDRQVDQVMIVKAAAEQLLSPGNILKLPELIDEVRHAVTDTNLSNADIISLGWLMKGVQGKDLEHIQIPGKSLMAADPLVGKELWYWVPDSKRVESISQSFLQ